MIKEYRHITNKMSLYFFDYTTKTLNSAHENDILRIWRYIMMTRAESNRFPLAMEPPKEQVTAMTSNLLDSVADMSEKSPRGRIIYPFHKSDKDNLHRMLNVLQPESYIQPHRHSDPPKAEAIIVLKGSLACICFSDKGKIDASYMLSGQSETIGIDIEPGVYHTIFALEPNTIVFEVKPGPYRKSSDKDFAEWAPKEFSDESLEYLETLYRFMEQTFNICCSRKKLIYTSSRQPMRNEVF